MKQGFSLVEVITVIAIMSILAVIAVASWRTFGRTLSLETVSQQVIIVLDAARNRTLGSQGDRQYGVHFAGATYTLFEGTSYNASAATNEVHTLPAGIEFGTIMLTGAGADVIFNRVSGTTDQSGTIELRLTADPGIGQTIVVAVQGQSDIAGSVNPTDSRLTDTRHVHLTLGWSIQGAGTLQLVWPDSGQTEDVSMADYFNVGETEFDWEDSIDVGGDEERLRIQTHSLDAANTVLSIERDRRINTQAVEISIDGQPIISYEADGAATVGGSGGTMEIL